MNFIKLIIKKQLIEIGVIADTVPKGYTQKKNLEAIQYYNGQVLLTENTLISNVIIGSFSLVLQMTNNSCPEFQASSFTILFKNAVGKTRVDFIISLRKNIVIVILV